MTIIFKKARINRPVKQNKLNFIVLPALYANIFNS